MVDAMEAVILKPKPIPQTALARWMWRNRWKASELAREVGLSEATVSRIAAGLYDPPAETAAKIKRATGLKTL